MIKALLRLKISYVFLVISLVLSPALFPQNVFASHIMGGEITAEHVGNLNYELRLVLYRDVTGITLPQTATLTLENLTTSAITTITATLDSSVLDTIMINMGFVIGVEGMYYKSSAIALMANTAYRISWESCCRNSTILNCTNPGSQSMHLTSLLTVPALPAFNSTPYYLAAPVAYLPIDTPWQHNPMPFDVDGDSLVWSIDTPWTAANTQIPGWTTPSAHPAGPFTINANNGQIDWEPNMLGSFIASILVEEFRAGIKIGEIKRDMQFIVVPDSIFISPRIGNFNTLPVDANGNAKVNVVIGTPYTITLMANDPQNDNVEFISLGEPYLLASNPASFTSTVIAPGQTNGTFLWTPLNFQARVKPYIVSFRVSDGLLAFDETLLIKVDGITSVQDYDKNSVGQSYPNPAQNILFVPFELKNGGDVVFEVFDLLGNKVASDVIKSYSSGPHSEKFNLNLPSGNYLMRISNDGKDLGSRKFIINK